MSDAAVRFAVSFRFEEKRVQKLRETGTEAFDALANMHRVALAQAQALLELCRTHDVPDAEILDALYASNEPEDERA